MTEATRKYRKQIVQLQDDLLQQKKINVEVSKEIAKLQGKLERYQSAEVAGDHQNMVYRESLEEEIRFLRELVTSLTVKPEIITAKSKHEVRMGEFRSREEARHRKEMQRQEREWKLEAAKNGKPTA